MDLADFRREKDAFFRDHPQSPLMPAQRNAFQGLHYYEPNPGLSLVLEPEPFDEVELVDMQTSTGDTARYLRWARVSFAVDGRETALTVYRDPGSNALFLPSRTPVPVARHTAPVAISMSKSSRTAAWRSTSTSPTTPTVPTTNSGAALSRCRRIA